MTDITFRYNRAPTGELSGESLVEQTEQALSVISTEASQAETDAAEALRVANLANQAAGEAVRTATTAAETATAAQTAAGTAQTTANSAVATANNALSTAQSAVSTAGGAVTAAQNAQTAAEAAQTAAEDAAQDAQDSETIAQNALGMAQSAVNTANTASATATQAQTNAQNAVSSAAQAVQDAQTAAAVATALSNLVPIGSYIAFAGSVVPDKYLLCNGAAVSRTDYAALYDVIGDTYGAGDGSTTFNLPNLTDKVLQGSSSAGAEKSAGLPNISGNAIIGHLPGAGERLGYWSGTDAFYAVSDFQGGIFQVSGTWQGTPSDDVLKIDASRVSSIYGNSATVQPPAVTALICIRYE